MLPEEEQMVCEISELTEQDRKDLAKASGDRAMRVLRRILCRHVRNIRNLCIANGKAVTTGEEVWELPGALLLCLELLREIVGREGED
jgi:hypothetical protein